MGKHFLLFVHFVIFSTILSAQPLSNCGQVFIGDSCNYPPTLSLCDLDGVTFNTQPSSSTTDHDPIWIGFYAHTNYVKLEFISNNCTSAGLTAAIIEANCDITTPNDSNSLSFVGCTTNNFTLESYELTPWKNYFIRIDPCDGYCDLTMNVTGGLPNYNIQIPPAFLSNGQTTLVANISPVTADRLFEWSTTNGHFVDATAIYGKTVEVDQEGIYTVKVTESNAPCCFNERSVTVGPESNDCNISNFVAWVDPNCNPNGSNNVLMDFDIANGNNQGFEFFTYLILDTFSFDNYPTENFYVQANLPANGSSYKVYVRDKGNSQCTSFAYVTTTDCTNGCDISNISVNQVCENGLNKIFFDFEYTGTSDSFIIIDENDFYKKFAYIDLAQNNVWIDYPSNSGFVFTIIDNKNISCRASYEGFFPECPTCDIDFTKFDITSGCDGTDHYIFTFDVEYTGTNDSFAIYRGTEWQGNFDSPNGIAIREATGLSSYEYKIVSLENDACFATATPELPDCDFCQISSFDVSGNCFGSDYYDLTFVLNYSGSNDSFSVFLNNEFLGKMTYAMTMQIETGLSNYEFEVINDTDPNCKASFTPTLPDCACTISNIQVTDTNCTANGKFDIGLSFSAENTSGQGFIVKAYDIYGDTSITTHSLEPQFDYFKAGNLQDITISVEDAGNSTCISEMVFTAPTCDTNFCYINNFVVTPDFNCHPDNTFDIDFDFDITEGLGNGFDFIHQNDTTYFNEYPSSPITIDHFFWGDGYPFPVKVQDHNNPECFAELTFDGPDCYNQTECIMIFKARSACENSKINVYFSLVGNYTLSSDSFHITRNGVDYGRFAYVDATAPKEVSIQLNGLIGDGSLPYVQQVYFIKDSQDADCIKNVVANIYPCDEEGCNITNLTANGDCDSEDQVFYVINLNYENDGIFQLQGSNENFGNFNFSELPITIHPTQNIGTLTATNEADGCTISINPADIACGQDCLISNLQLTPNPNCNDDGTFDLKLNFDIEGGSNLGFDMIVNETDSFHYSQYPDSNFVIEHFLQGNSQNVFIEIQDKGNPDCNEFSEFTAPNCNSSICSINNITATENCDDEQLMIEINFEHSATSDSFEIFHNTGQPQSLGVFHYAELPVLISPEEEMDQYEIFIQDLENDNCSSTILFEPNCFNIWPGDINLDGQVNIHDLTYWGIAFGAEGPARLDQSTTWSAKSASAFDQSFENGVNYAHADCNGNGKVGWNDMIPISSNYDKSQGTMIPYQHIEGQPTDPILYLDLSEVIWESGQEVSIPIILGDSDISIENLYGLSFHIVYPNDLFENGLLVRFDDSWLIKTTTVLQNKQDDLVAIGYTRTFGEGSAGSGLIGTAEGIISHLRSPNGPMNIGIEEAVAFTKSLERIPLRFDTDTISTATYILDFEKEILIYPNPTSNRITFESPSVIQTIEIIDMLGQNVHTIHSEIEKVEFSTSRLSEGVYFAKINIDGYVYVKKFEVMR